MAATLMCSCTGRSASPLGLSKNGYSLSRRGRVPQASDTLYTEKAAMDVYGTQPERALEIIDSAEIVGNLTADRASLLRAKVFCLTCGEERLDTARQICEALLKSDFVKDVPDYREPVLDLLVTISRKKHDNEQWLRWATEKANFCRQQGNKTEALRTEAEIGIILTHLGRQDEGMAKLDNVIYQLDDTRKFNETDACIIALRRKVDVLNEQRRFADIIPLAEKIVEKMNDYEQHPEEYHDGTYREPEAADVPDFCDFYRTKGYAYLVSAYASLSEKEKAREYLGLFEQSRWGQTLDGRKMIAPTWCKLGDYDKMLAVYDEMEQHMGTNTMCFDYAAILHDRAVAAEALNHYAEAYDYMSRYAALSQSLNDSLQASEAHEYAARYHAQEQQLQMEREQAKSARNAFLAWSIAVTALLLACFAVYYYLRHREESRKNRILARQITEAIKYKELYLASEEFLKGQASQGTERRVKSEEFAAATGKTDPDDLDSFSNEQLFDYLNEVIVREQLYLDPKFSRQALINRFHLSKERIGSAFSRGSDHNKLTDYIQGLRLERATQQLVKQTDKSIVQISSDCGFSSYSYFCKCFRQQYGMTPSEFRTSTQRDM